MQTASTLEKKKRTVPKDLKQPILEDSDEEKHSDEEQTIPESEEIARTIIDCMLDVVFESDANVASD